MLTLGPATLAPRTSGALWWPDQRLLAVSDLHLGKSLRLARRGGTLLPPYETRATLDRLSAEIDALAPRLVLCLGDSFDDLTAAETLPEPDALQLARLMAGRDWLWIEGNHDAGPLALGGTHLAQARIGGLSFRHIADPSESLEVSGHYHPKARLGPLSRPCFLADRNRVILPAFGAYTGGLWCEDAAFGFMGRDARAILTGAGALTIPMPRRTQEF